MNREEIIKMAKEAGWTGLYITWAEPTGEPNWTPFKESMTVPVTIEQVERFASLVAAAERERCAKVCEEKDEFCANTINNGAGVGCLICADSIRALES